MSSSGAADWASRNQFDLTVELGLDQSEFRADLLSKVLESRENTSKYYLMRKRVYQSLVKKQIHSAFDMCMKWLMEGKDADGLSLDLDGVLIPATPESVARPIAYEFASSVGKLFAAQVDSILPPSHTDLSNSIRQAGINQQTGITI